MATLLATIGAAFSSLFAPTTVGAGLSAGVGAATAGTAASTGLFGTGITAGQIGTGLSALGTLYGGIRSNQAAKAEAKQMKQKGDEELAISQRRASERRKEKERAQSRALAVAGASGAGTRDPTVTQIMAGIENQGEYNALTELYTGQMERNSLRAGASARRAEGRSDLFGSVLSAGSTIYSDYRRKNAYGYG